MKKDLTLFGRGMHNPVARSYGKALASLPSPYKERLFQDLQSLSLWFQEEAKSKTWLTRPLCPERRKAVLDEAAQSLQLSKEGLKLLALLIRNGRLAYVDSILEVFYKMKEEKKGSIFLQMRVAHSADMEKQKQWELVFSNYFSSPVELTVTVDSDLKAGGILFWKSYMIDFSLKKKLALLFETCTAQFSGGLL